MSLTRRRPFLICQTPDAVVMITRERYQNRRRSCLTGPFVEKRRQQSLIPAEILHDINDPLERTAMDNTLKGASSEEARFRIEEHDVRIGDILAEARAFSGVAGILFGFLLTVSIAYIDRLPGIVGLVLLVLALASTASATLIFLLPPLYHHLRFPMDRRQVAQFYWRSHKFLLWGIVPLYAGVYFSVLLALYNVIGAYAGVLAAGIFVIPVIAYRLRKIGSPKEVG